jgi:CheY-like chemotaxis protein
MLPSEFEILTAVSGEEGLVVLHDHGPFALVVCDMQMTGMDGVEFLRRVRQLAPNTVRLLLSGRIDLKGAVDAINDGCVFRLLLKPCERNALTEAIRAALDSYSKLNAERVRIELPVHLYRSGRGLRPQSAYTADISTTGARLAGLKEPLDPGELLDIECSNKRATFRVVWIGAPGTITEDQAGLECLTADADIWKLDICSMEDGEALERARVVQRGLMPQVNPPLTTLDYAGHCIQARMIGGDYYDFFDMGPGEVGFVLADVAGKGIPAALLMASLQGSLRTLYSVAFRNLDKLLVAVNLHLYKHTSQNRFATCFLGHYSDATRTLRYVNCGHNPPLLLRKGGAVERLAATGTVLGLFSDWECFTAAIHVQPEDVLCMYTDGITETTGSGGKEFGEASLLASMRDTRDL